MDVSVKSNISDVLKNFDSKTQARLQRNIFDRLVRKAGKDTKKRIREKYNLKAGDIKIKVTTSKPNHLVGYLEASARKLPLTKFNPIASAGGMVVSVVKGASTFINNAFIAQPQGRDYRDRGQSRKAVRKYSDVFIRTGQNAYPLDAKGIKEEHSMSIGEYLGSKENLNEINIMLNRERPNIERAVVDSFVNKKVKKILSDD